MYFDDIVRLILDLLGVNNPYVNVVLQVVLVLAVLYSIIIILVIISENRDPSKTLAWVLLCFFLPFLGSFIYIMFGQNWRRKRLVKKANLPRLRSIRDPRQTVNGGKCKVHPHCDTTTSGHRLMRMLTRNRGAEVWPGNKVTVLQDGKQTFQMIMKDMKKAKHHIHLEYYIVKHSEIYSKLEKILIAKAKEGVEVRLLYDGVGGQLSGQTLKRLHDAGIHTSGFLKTTLPLGGLTSNYRLHRKIVVIDGNVGFVGGLNIGDEYITGGKEFSKWRDTHCRIEGDAVSDLQFVFQKDWYIGSKEIISGKKYFPRWSHPSGDDMVQVIESGPDSAFHHIHQGYMGMIMGAHDRLYTGTPYLILDPAIKESIRTAALSGVDVRIIVPAKPIGWQFLAFWAARTYYFDLLLAGARIYEYDGGFIHQKIMLADDDISSIGTTNMDVRSFFLNFEVNAFIYSKRINNKLAKDFLKDLEECTEITMEKYQARPRHEKFKESVARLFSPLL